MTPSRRGGRGSRPCRGPLGGEVVLARGGLELLELELQLVEQARAALGPLPVERAPQLLDLEPERRDHRLGARGRGPRPGRLVRHRVRASLGGRERGAQGLDVGLDAGHGRSLACPGRTLGAISATGPAAGGDQPAAAGLQVWRGFLQSIPSRRYAICAAEIATAPSRGAGQTKRPCSNRFM